jgi:hypothetical protein
MKANKDAVFPKKWSLFVSNDNSTWEPISDNNTPLCKEENIYTVETGEKKYCREEDVFTYSTNHSGFHYFVKFVMKENSYYSSNNAWQDSLSFTGFEMIGSFTRDSYIRLSCMNKRNAINLILITTLVINSK